MAKRNKPKPVIISPQAKEDINNILSYLSQNWSQKVVDEFLQKFEVFFYIISINPKIFGYYNKRRNIRKYALTKQNIIYTVTGEHPLRSLLYLMEDNILPN